MQRVQFPLKTCHPHEYKALPIPAPLIEKDAVVATLKHSLRLSRELLQLWHVLAFVNIGTGRIAHLQMERHYYEILTVFDIVLDHLTKYHRGNGYTKNTMGYRMVWYKWKKKWEDYYQKPYDRFTTCFKDFINIMGLPVCAYRIVPNGTGTFSFAGCVKKGEFEDGSPDEQRGCETESYGITDEWACRLFALNTPQYRSTLNFECRAGTNIEEGLLLEKGTIFDQWMDQSFPEKAECILVTGRGFCDENTRALLKYVQLYFSGSPSDIDFPMKGLTDMGAAGVSLLNALNKPGRPFLPHEHFNLKLGWIGLNPRFMREVFPNELYTAKSKGGDDVILENLGEPERGFVEARTDDEESNRRKRELRDMHSTAASDFDWTGPEGKKIDLDTLDESTLMCATKWFMKNDRHL